MVLRLGYNMGSQGTFIPPHFGPDGFWVVGQFEIRAGAWPALRLVFTYDQLYAVPAKSLRGGENKCDLVRGGDRWRIMQDQNTVIH